MRIWITVKSVVFGLFLSRIRFWLSYPLQITAFALRQQKYQRQIVPRLWLSHGQLIERDFSFYDDPSAFNKEFIGEMAAARDELLSAIKRQSLISTSIFLFLLANYFSISIDTSIAGFPIKYTPGIPEGLLLISTLLGCYTLVLQGNAYLLDSSIKFAIKKSIPEELQRIYLLKYFAHETVGGYSPFNLPHILPSRFTSRLGMTTMFLFLALLIGTLIAHSAANVALLLHHLWFKPNFGVWSTVILIYLLLCLLCAWMYVIVTRIRLPYYDYTINHELQLLEQIDPARMAARRKEVYGPMIDDQLDMEARGYLKPRRQTRTNSE